MKTAKFALFFFFFSKVREKKPKTLIYLYKPKNVCQNVIFLKLILRYSNQIKPIKYNFSKNKNWTTFKKFFYNAILPLRRLVNIANNISTWRNVYNDSTNKRIHGNTKTTKFKQSLTFKYASFQVNPLFQTKIFYLLLRREIYLFGNRSTFENLFWYPS